MSAQIDRSFVPFARRASRGADRTRGAVEARCVRSADLRLHTTSKPSLNNTANTAASKRTQESKAVVLHTRVLEGGKSTKGEGGG